VKPRIKVHSIHPPALAKLGSVLYVVPSYQAVPHGTTLKDLEWVPLHRPAQQEKVKEYKVKSYTVRVFGNGTRVTCDCPGYTYRKKCKHSEEYRR
jgi:hypothetical protein